MSTNSKMGTITDRQPRKRWPEALKREIVAATFAPGASVSIVARRYDVNANQVFIWRRRYGQQPAVRVPAAPEPRPQLVAVTVAPEPESVGGNPPVLGTRDTFIEIVVGERYRVRVGAHSDVGLLTRILDCLARR